MIARIAVVVLAVKTVQAQMIHTANASAVDACPILTMIRRLAEEAPPMFSLSETVR